MVLVCRNMKGEAAIYRMERGKKANHPPRLTHHCAMSRHLPLKIVHMLSLVVPSKDTSDDSSPS